MGAHTGTRVAALVCMMKSLLALTLAGAAFAGCAGSATVEVEPTPGASLTVVNDSDFTLYDIYLTETDNPYWRSNLVRGDVLYPDEELSLGVPCDFYDALIVDEEGVECEVHDLDLCLNDAEWIIRNNTCTVFEAEAARRAAQN